MAKKPAGKAKGRSSKKSGAKPSQSTAKALAASTRKREVEARIARNQAEQERVKADLARLRASERELRATLKRTTDSLKASKAESRRLLQGTAQRFILADPKSRRYFDRLTGEFLSRRETVQRKNEGRSPEQIANDNLLKLARERTTAEGREKARKEIDKRGRAKAFAERFKEKKARELGVNPSDIKIRGDSATAREFKTLTRLTSARRDKVRNGKATRREVRAYVDALIAMGIIEDDDRDEWISHYTGE